MKSHTYSPLNHRPARPGITSQRPKMAAYLAGAAGTAALLGAPQAEAAVTAVTFGFGPTLEKADGPGFLLFSVNSGFGNITGYTGNSPDKVGLGSYSFGPVYHTASFSSFTGLPNFFANGTVIGGGGNGAKGYAFFEHNNAAINFTDDQLNKNVAFRTTSNNWGWANVSWNNTSKVVTVHSAYVESIAGNTIIVGDIGAVPEPSRALLALAGLGGVALRRRRKQAA
jgi:hypothetical protein